MRIISSLRPGNNGAICFVCEDICPFGAASVLFELVRASSCICCRGTIQTIQHTEPIYTDQYYTHRRGVQLR